MILNVFIQQNLIKVNLIEKGRVLDSEIFSYYHDVSEKLITSLDKLLKRNNIDTTALKSFKIRGNTGKNSTSYKIAAAFIGGLKTFMK
ncbi:MAG: hypothetical protein AAB792_02795 [Patescibacteria group bacterium]